MTRRRVAPRPATRRTGRGTEDLGSVVDAGAGIQDCRTANRLPATPYVHNSSGPQAGQEYGSVLAGFETRY